jgi:teichuronic acid biosynthesis glycosyltransferase TuaC
MHNKNLLVITNSYPNSDNTYVGDVFVKEQIKYIRSYFNHVSVISPVAHGMEYLRKTKFSDYRYDNVSVFFPRYYNLPFFYSKFRDKWTALETNAIQGVIERENISFDLIHAHFTWPSGAVAVRLKEKYNVPVVITEHTHRTLYYELDRHDQTYIRTWNAADAIIRVNKKDIPLFTNVGVPENKLFAIANGYDDKKYFPVPASEARKKLGIDTEKKIIIHISRLSEIKGQKYLIDAMGMVNRKRSDVICYIGGTGPLKDALQARIREIQADENIKMIGFVPDDDMVLWMNAAVFFVLPSLGEGNPTVMFETLGCGKPFVGTKVGGVPEIITSDTYGLLVEPADPEDLAEKILLALDRKWDQEAIHSYSEQFTWENITREIIRVYEHVLKEPRERTVP